MISAFLPLILLAYGTVESEGVFLFLPATTLAIWVWVTVLAIYVFIPGWLAGRKETEDGPGISFLTALTVFQWGVVGWILLLQLTSAPARLLFPWLSRVFPQAWPMLVSTILYVWLAWSSRTTFQKAYRLLLHPDQTPEEFFRARLSLPIMFFPPMLVWMSLEDIWMGETAFSGLSDLETFAVAPLFFLALYLLAPHLFNLAWRAAPMADENLRGQILDLAFRAETPISGVRVWDTFKEPIPNAAVAGLSSRFRFVYITQYLLDLFPSPQIISIVAHELGHLRLGHVWTYLIFSLDLIFLSLWVKLEMSFRFPWLMLRYQGFESSMDLIAFMGFFLFLFTALTRQSEFEADRFSATLTGGDLFASTLRTLQEFITPPHPWTPRFFMTHPDFPARIDGATSWRGSLEDLIGTARTTRRLLICVGALLLILSWPSAGLVFEMAMANRSMEEGNFNAALERLKMLPAETREHPQILEILARGAVRQGRWPLAVYLVGAGTWQNWLRIGPPLEVFEHSASPEVALHFQIMQFLLQPLDLGRAHGVSLLDEVLDHVQVALGQH